MKILVLSDSHKVLTNLSKIFDELANRLDAVIHLGDNTEDMSFHASKYKDIAFHTVRGNCDFSDAGEYEKLISVSGKKIYITHGHRLNVKSGLQRLVYTAEEKDVDICLYGHTHISSLFLEGRTVFMNPGSVSIPRDGGVPSYGIIELGSKTSYISVVSIYKHGFEMKCSLPL